MGLAVNASIVDPLLTGLGVYTVNLVQELAKFRPDLLVYTSHPNVFAGNSIRVRTLSSPMGPAFGKSAHLRRLLWTQWGLPRRMIRDQVSLLLSTVPEGVIRGTIPQYLVVHDVTPLRFPKEYFLQRWYFQCYVGPLLRQAKGIIAVSEQTKTDVMSAFDIPPAGIHVVPGGCNHQVFHRDINPKAVKEKYGLDAYVLYVGNFHPHKNLSRLIQAFHRLGANRREQLVIAGKKDSRYFPPLAALVEQLGLQGHVVFPGYIPDCDLPGLYAGAKVLVLPSLYEGFGLPLLEAMACGTPVIAARTGAMPELVDGAGLLVNPASCEEIAQAIRTVVTDREIRERLCGLGVERAGQFSWHDTAEKIARVLEESNL